MNMTVKCTVCGLIETLDNESLEELSGIVRKYKMSADSYTYLLNKMRGKCLDTDEHSFIFDEEFMKQIQDIVDKDKNSWLEIRKLKTINEGLKKESDEFIVKVEENQSKYDSNKNRIKNLDQSCIENENEIEKITGSRNIDIWK